MPTSSSVGSSPWCELGERDRHRADRTAIVGSHPSLDLRMIFAGADRDRDRAGRDPGELERAVAARHRAGVRGRCTRTTARTAFAHHARVRHALLRRTPTTLPDNVAPVDTTIFSGATPAFASTAIGALGAQPVAAAITSIDPGWTWISKWPFGVDDRASRARTRAAHLAGAAPSACTRAPARPPSSRPCRVSVTPEPILTITFWSPPSARCAHVRVAFGLREQLVRRPSRGARARTCRRGRSSRTRSRAVRLRSSRRQAAHEHVGERLARFVDDACR